ncbi:MULTISPECIES: DUF6602 domain-containing protein [Haloferax]|uniref:DUF6602 domain-containing protein n=1 Tax=Haloferax marinum TaxID=2666143 RepID=A0A6A8G8P2_9EURY|nr:MULTISPECIES: DUF6602 domain-containing protein [Haloferax]KAB1198277.1 hypothetical protein Hfx1150_12440 [Haloferax sp. CBA1150]MRW97371.1 hypothetical protein [Haloferax marinum]
MNLDIQQLALVKDSRRAWWRGFRHTGMAGDIRSKRLIAALEAAIPELSFHSGIVNTGTKRHDWDKEDLSSQCDIIVHSGQPWEQMEEYVIVPPSDATCIIEVKSWVSKKDFKDDESGINAQLTKLKKETGLPVFLVAFRHSTQREDLISASVADGTFILASGSNATTENIVYPGALQALVAAIDEAVEDQL